MTTEAAIVALLAVTAGSLLKSISGLGLPLVTIPAVSYVADIETAVAVTAVPNLALNGALAWMERSSWPETRDLPVLGGAGFVGAVVGTIVLVSVPEEPLIAVLVLIVVVYAVTFFTNPEFRLEPRRARRFAPVVGTAAGAMQGAVGISGPIVASWIHSYRLPRDAYIFSVTALFAIAGLAQIPTLLVSGRISGLWTVSAIACLPALGTIPIGGRLRRTFSSVGFDRFVVVTLTVSVVGLGIRTFT